MFNPQLWFMAAIGIVASCLLSIQVWASSADYVFKNAQVYTLNTA